MPAGNRKYDSVEPGGGPNPEMKFLNDLTSGKYTNGFWDRTGDYPVWTEYPGGYQWNPSSPVSGPPIFGHQSPGGYEDYLRRLNPTSNQYNNPWANLSGRPNMPDNTKINAGAVGDVGLRNLFEILLTRGVVDPGYQNRQLLESGRRTEANVGAIQGNLAQRGLTGAGEGFGLQAAARESGATRDRDIVAADVRRGEDRNMQALQLLMQLFGAENQKGQLQLGRDSLNYQQDYDELNRYLGAAGALADPFIDRLMDAISGGGAPSSGGYTDDDPGSFWSGNDVLGYPYNYGS